MKLIEIPVPAALATTAATSLAAIEQASLPEAPVPTPAQAEQAVNQAYVDRLADDVWRYLPDHNPSDDIYRDAARAIRALAENPNDSLAHCEVRTLRHFAFSRPLLDVLGPQPPIPAERIPVVEPTFVASARRRDREAVQLLGDALGGPAVDAICEKFGLDLQWMHA